MLQSFFLDIEDFRRAEGKRYQLGHVLLFSVFALLSGADSYRTIARFIRERYRELDAIFDLNWKRYPAYTTIRTLIQQTPTDILERQFRQFSACLAETQADASSTIAVDGKVLRGSLDRFKDQKAVQLLSVFLTGPQIILGHMDMDKKSNEIPSAQALLQELQIEGHVVTLDALHCQKNIRGHQESGR